MTSYKPLAAEIKGEESGEGLTERLRQFDIYRRMLAEWFNEPTETAVNKIETFEKEVLRRRAKPAPRLVKTPKKIVVSLGCCASGDFVKGRARNLISLNLGSSLNHFRQ